MAVINQDISVPGSGKESIASHEERQDNLSISEQKLTSAERRLVRKLDLHLLPVLTMLYLLSFLDRSNIGNAKLDGLTADLKMTQADYLNALTLV